MKRRTILLLGAILFVCICVCMYYSVGIIQSYMDLLKAVLISVIIYMTLALSALFVDKIRKKHG